MISDIPQFDALFHRQFFLCHLRKTHIRIFPGNLILQIIADSHKERLIKRHRSKLVIDPVGAGHHTHRRHHKGREHRSHFFHALPLTDQYHHIPYQRSNTDRLDQKPRNTVIQSIFLYRIHIAPAALDIFFRKILLFSGYLYFLDPLHRLGYPLKQPAVKVLIFLPRLIHDRLYHFFNNKQRGEQRQRNDHCHFPVRSHHNAEQHYKNNDLRDQLQQRQNQRVHIIDIRGDIPLNNGCIRVQIKFIALPEIIFHHPLGSPELVCIDKPVHKL